MNYKTFLQVVVLLVLVALALFVIRRQPGSQPVKVTDFPSCELAGGAILETEPPQCMALDGRYFTAPVNPESEVVVDQPAYGAMVTNPLIVKGKVRGNWFFEDNLPVTLKDANGKILAQKGFHAKGDWMTPEFVEFEGTLEFTLPDTDLGVLIIQKDNPSDMRQFDASVAVPVRFRLPGI